MEVIDTDCPEINVVYTHEPHLPKLLTGAILPGIQCTMLIYYVFDVSFRMSYAAD